MIAYMKTAQFLNHIKTVDLSVSQLSIYGNEKEKLVVSDPTQPTPRKGQFFVCMPHQLTKELTGSVCLPEELQQVCTEGSLDTEKCLSDFISKAPSESQQLTLGRLTLLLYHGSSNAIAIDNSRLAVKGYTAAEDRAQFQLNIATLLKPVFEYKSDYDVRIIEDCIASGDSLIGIIAFLARNVSSLRIKKVRIDVVVATIQGILLLSQFASQNDIFLELHVGYLAYGLSRGRKVGETGVQAHANYITYPKEILTLFPAKVQSRLEVLRSSDGYIYVVGDMGDGARSLPHTFDKSHPWNVSREYDLHGDRGKYEHQHAETISMSEPLHIFLSNGGFLVRSIYRYLSKQEYLNEIVISAKRVWSDDSKYGYGVLIDEVKETFFPVS